MTAEVRTGAGESILLLREDVITLRIPALRDRPDDAPLLVAHMLRKHAPGRRIRVARAAMDRPVAYAWPGNVRQLENEVRRALVLCDGVIECEHLSADAARTERAAQGRDGTLRQRLDALEAELVKDALARTKGNQTHAAKLLGVSRFGLQKMIERLGVE